MKPLDTVRAQNTETARVELQVPKGANLDRQQRRVWGRAEAPSKKAPRRPRAARSPNCSIDGDRHRRSDAAGNAGDATGCRAPDPPVCASQGQ